MEIAVLVENSCQVESLEEEFGLSLLVRTSSATILFDMGSTNVFARNAQKMDVNLTEVDFGVVSHAHYDHGGGLATFLQMNATAKVYCSSNADGQYYGNIGVKLPALLEPFLFPLVRNRLCLSRYIGLEKSLFSDFTDRFVFVESVTEISDNVFLVTEILGDNPAGEGNKYLLQRRGDTLQRDRFTHELIMVIKDEEGCVIFTGCGHRGILNMVETVQHHFKGVPIKAVVGGFHLALQPGKPGIGGKKHDIVNIAEKLVSAGVKKVITGHCTGEDASLILKEILGQKFIQLSTGLKIIL